MHPALCAQLTSRKSIHIKAFCHLKGISRDICMQLISMYVAQPSLSVVVTKCNLVPSEPPIILYRRTYINSNKNKMNEVSNHDYLRERHQRGQVTLTRPHSSPTANQKETEQKSNADTVVHLQP